MMPLFLRYYQSCQPDITRRPTAWKAVTLPLSYFRLNGEIIPRIDYMLTTMLRLLAWQDMLLRRERTPSDCTVLRFTRIRPSFSTV